MTGIKDNTTVAQSSGDTLGTEESAPDLALRELPTQWRGKEDKQMELGETNRRASRTNQDSLRGENITSAKIFAEKVSSFCCCF